MGAAGAEVEALEGAGQLRFGNAGVFVGDAQLAGAAAIVTASPRGLTRIA